VPGNLAKFRDRAANTRNKAIFEVPDMLQQVLTQSIHDERTFSAFSAASSAFSA